MQQAIRNSLNNLLQDIDIKPVDFVPGYGLYTYLTRGDKLCEELSHFKRGIKNIINNYKMSPEEFKAFKRERDRTMRRLLSTHVLCQTQIIELYLGTVTGLVAGSKIYDFFSNV